MLSKTIFSCIALVLAVNLSAEEPTDLAAEIIKLTGIESGLCTVLDCIDAELPVKMVTQGRFLVHAIAVNDLDAGRLRDVLGTSAQAGMISVESVPINRLPYNTRTVDVMISTSPLPQLIERGLSADDVLRVLTPNGKACFVVDALPKDAITKWLSESQVKDYVFTQATHEWLVITNPRDARLDDWGHLQHGPDGNPVSRDRIIETPKLLQWIVGPNRNYGRGDIGTLGSQPVGLISADGRNYYLQGGNIVTRNAFNGILLWTREAAGVSLARIVGSAKDLYVYQKGELMAWDGRTGETKLTYAKSISCSKLMVDDGFLVVVGSEGIKAFNADSGAAVWSYNQKLDPAYVQGGKLFGKAGPNELQCISLKEGKLEWKINPMPLPGGKPALNFVSKGMILCSSGRKIDNKSVTTIAALNGNDGSKVWEQTSNMANPSVYEAGDLLWIESSAPEKPKEGVMSLWIGYDLKSGVEKLRHTGPANIQYKCYAVYATDRFMIANRPLYFMDWMTGQSHTFEAARAQCGFAYCLGQGLFFGLYTTPDKCMCTSTVIEGINAFAPDSTMNGEMPISEHGRFKQGPAKAPESVTEESLNDIWPIYRNDPRRTASSATAAPSHMKIAWATTLKDIAQENYFQQKDWKVSTPSGDFISAPTIGGGMVFVSLIHDHQVVALDSTSGKVVWRIQTPARVTTPPTYYQGLCLYGCHDGRVYCVRADNGEQVWNFRAAPDERRIMAFGQIESSWPIEGGVLIVDDMAYVVAGRVTETDGGIYIYALNPRTGDVIWNTHRGRTDDSAFGAYQPRRLLDFLGTVDILCSDGKILGMAGSNRGRMDCKTGDFIKHFNDRIGFSWNRTRYRKDQFGSCIVPVAWLKKSYFDCENGKTISSHGATGWKYPVPDQAKVESLVVISPESTRSKPNDWRPTIRVPMVDGKPPVIDGTIDKVFLDSAAPLSFSYLNGRQAKPQEATTAWILRDKESLYLAFRCEKKDMSNLVSRKTKRDDQVWEDEVIEVFLDPIHSRSKNYYHFIFNSDGVVEDSYKGDSTWNGDIEVKTTKNDDAWILEVRLPFTDMPGNASAQENLWTLNLNRSARNIDHATTSEDTAWSPTMTDSSHMPDMFGNMWLDSASGDAIDAAYKNWFATLPEQPKSVADAGAASESFILAAVAKDNRDYHQGGEVIALALADGKPIGRCDLPVSPAFDGMAAAGGRIYVTLRDMTVICLDKQ